MILLNSVQRLNVTFASVGVYVLQLWVVGLQLDLVVDIIACRGHARREKESRRDAVRRLVRRVGYICQEGWRDRQKAERCKRALW